METTRMFQRNRDDVETREGQERWNIKRMGKNGNNGCIAGSTYLCYQELDKKLTAENVLGIMMESRRKWRFTGTKDKQKQGKKNSVTGERV